MSGKQELQPTDLERVYDFENLPFRQYMYSRASKRDELLQHIDTMQVGHPIVEFAAGCAAAELALHRPRTRNRDGDIYTEPSLSLEKRMAALDLAGVLWARSENNFRNIEEDRLTQRMLLHAREMRFRVAQSIAFIPLMGVGASWLDKRPLDAQETADRREQTAQQMLAYSRRINNLPRHERALRESRAGLMAEALCGLLALRDEPQRFITVPTPLRIDHNFRRSLRADYWTIADGPLHRRSLIQVKSSRRIAGEGLDKASKEKDLTIDFVGQDDFVLTSGAPMYKTLNALAADKLGECESDTSSRLDVLARVMTLRIDDFQPKLENGQHIYVRPPMRRV